MASAIVRAVTKALVPAVTTAVVASQAAKPKLIKLAPKRPKKHVKANKNKQVVVYGSNQSAKSLMKRRTAPSTFGMTMTSTNSFNSISYGRAEPNNDLALPGLRVSGRAWRDTVTGQSASIQSGWGTAYGSQKFYAPLSPGWLSSLTNSRLEIIEGTFQFYIIREVRFHYVTLAPSSTQGSVTIAISNDYEDGAGMAASPNYPGLLDYPSGSTSLWASANDLLVYKNHGGKKMYECYSSSAESGDNRFQGCMIALLLGQPGGTTNWGYFVIDYIVDFYGQAQYEVNIDASTGLTLTGKPLPDHISSHRILA